MSMMSMGDNWFSGPVRFDLKNGTKTNIRRSKSGKLWSTYTPNRDALTLHFEDLRVKDAKAILNWLYENSSKGSKDDADAFELFVERREARYSQVSEGLENGFKGTVRLPVGDFATTLNKAYVKNFSINLEIISYAPF